MLQNFRADDKIEPVISKRQANHICRRKAPDAASVFAQTIVQPKSFGGFGQVLEFEIGADGDHIF